MSASWGKRKSRLGALLKTRQNEDEDGLALDRLLHGQSVIGKTARTTEIETLRFQDKDLSVVGTLEYGQFGVIDVVNCNLDGRVYVRKSTEKRFALRTRDQCSPQFERDILLRATKEDSRWAPHLLCAFQTPTHLNLIMDYASGGTLWDILESSPHDGKILEADLRWWVPQIVSAIHWCHSQGFAHRDIKPHNFVLTPDAHVLLIDFGSAAPLLPPGSDGSQKLLKRYCLVPCGTCDYISPEILQAHEEALVALEMDDDSNGELESPLPEPVVDGQGYGLETDWWSLGAMLYEMVYGVAPFFADDIRQTYVKILDYERSLRFLKSVKVSHEYQDLLRRLLTRADRRLGRRNVMEITEHRFFDGINWSTLPTKNAPPGLHLPQFTYADTAPASLSNNNNNDVDQSNSQAFAFSALFQSSKASSVSPGMSILQQASSPVSNNRSTSQRDDNNLASFIGFSWGPKVDAFPTTAPTALSPTPKFRSSLSPAAAENTPRPNRMSSFARTPGSSGSFLAPGFNFAYTTPGQHPHAFATPNNRHSSMIPHGTIRASTIRRTGPRRAVSDREAMKQLVNCIGMSARKKVLESGRKPRYTMSFGSISRSGTGTLKKELRFLPSPVVVRDYASSSQGKLMPALAVSTSSSFNASRSGSGFGLGIGDDSHSEQGTTDSESAGPPSPSPSPRPGSAMSRRSGTPTLTMTGTTGTFSSQRSGFVIGSGLAGTTHSATQLLPPTRPGSALRFAEFGTDSRLEETTSSVSRSRLGNVSSLWQQPQRPQQQRKGSIIAASTSTAQFDTMEQRHRCLMDAVVDMERRLNDFSATLVGAS